MAAVIDAFLLSLFPGRTLEELDDIDYFRLLRALKVKEIGEIEATALGYRQGVVQATSITAKQWEKIAENDRIVDSFIDTE